MCLNQLPLFKQDKTSYKKKGGSTVVQRKQPVLIKIGGDQIEKAKLFSPADTTEPRFQIFLSAGTVSEVACTI